MNSLTGIETQYNEGNSKVQNGHTYNIILTGSEANGRAEAKAKEEAYDEEKAEKKAKFIRALDTLSYQSRKDRNPDRVPGTCEWFLSHKKFRDWHEGKSSTTLWVSADPGCGKSVLIKHLVDHIILSTGSRTVCYFFFKDDFEDQKKVANAFCCILHQLFTQRPKLFSDAILRTFETSARHLLDSFEGLWDILINAADGDENGEIICILDALDECEDEGRIQLSRALERFYRALH